MSLPCAIGTRPVATAAAAPPDEPPGVRFGFQGLSVRPCNALLVNQRNENAGVLLRATKTAPAALRRAAKGPSVAAILSLSATTPSVVACPPRSTFILIATGTPCNGPSGAPAATA